MGSSDDEDASNETSPIFQLAIDEVLEDSDNKQSTKELTKEVIQRLLYYFDVKQKLEDSSEFVDAILSKAEGIQSDMGGNLHSAIHQALRSYKTFFREEIKSHLEEQEEDSDEDAGEEEGEESMPEEEDLDNDDEGENDWASSNGRQLYCTARPY